MVCFCDIPLHQISVHAEGSHGYGKFGTLRGYGGEIFSYKFFVPQNVQSYEEFVSKIHISEANLDSELL